MKATLYLVFMVALAAMGRPPAKEESMSNLIQNGGFDGSLEGWTQPGGLPPAAWVGTFGHDYPGAAKMEGFGGDASTLEQYPVIPELGKYHIRWCMLFEGAGFPHVRVRLSSAQGTMFDWLRTPQEDPLDPLAWQCWDFIAPCLAGTATLRVESFSGMVTYLDDVELESVQEDRGYLTYFRKRLMEERGDPGGVFHTRAEYEDAIQDAAADAPREVWPTVESETLLQTVLGQVDYSLAAATPPIEQPADLLRVQIGPVVGGSPLYEDWPVITPRVVSDAGILRMRFTQPLAGGYPIRILWRYRPTSPELDTETELPVPWLISAAMNNLLRRKPIDWDFGEWRYHLEYWAAKEIRERIAHRVARPPGRAIRTRYELKDW